MVLIEREILARVISSCFAKRCFPKYGFFSLKVIPLFCTAHPLLRITLWHPRWRRFFSLAQKNKGRLCRAKAFIRNNNAADRLTASWSAIEKQENERNVCDAELCSRFLLRGRRVVELLKCPGWGFGLWGGPVEVGRILDSYANPRRRLGLHNFLEFFQSLSCLYQAMQTRKTFSIA